MPFKKMTPKQRSVARRESGATITPAEMRRYTKTNTTTKKPIRKRPNSQTTRRKTR